MWSSRLRVPGMKGAMSACHTATRATLAAKLPASVLKSSTASASSMAWREQGEAQRLSRGRVGRSRLEFDVARWLASGSDMTTSQRDVASPALDGRGKQLTNRLSWGHQPL